LAQKTAPFIKRGQAVKNGRFAWRSRAYGAPLQNLHALPRPHRSFVGGGAIKAV